MTTTPDPILAALGGSIPAARKVVAGDIAVTDWRADDAIRALANLALDAMERPDGGDEKLLRLIERMDEMPVNKDTEWRQGYVAAVWEVRGEIKALLSEPAWDYTNLSDRNGALIAENATLTRERDEANRDARNAADMMMTANNEAVRYMRERDEARADQAAMARRQLEAFGSDALNLRALPVDAPVQVVRDIIAEKLRARLAAMPAEKPAEPAAKAGHVLRDLAPEEADDPMPDAIHTSNVCAIRRRSDGYWWGCDSEHGAGWSDKRIRQAWTMRLAIGEVKALARRGTTDVEIVELGPKPAEPAAVEAAEKPAEPVRGEDEFKPLRDLVQRFSAALLVKLIVAEMKYGHADAWLADDWHGACVDRMREHIAKGDPRDVAAYCAFMWHHGWSTRGAEKPAEPANPPASPDGSTADAEARIAAMPSVEDVDDEIMAFIDSGKCDSMGIIVTLRRVLDERDDLMRSLAADNAKAQAEVERLTNLLDDTSNEAATLRDALETARAEIATCDRRRPSTMAHMEDLRAKLAEAEAAPKTINMNDRVCVRLTDVGRSVLHANHLAMFGSKRPYMPPSENGGWTAWHLWELMQEFGHRTGMGLPPCFETTIRLSAEAAKPDAGDDAQEGDERMDDWPFRDYDKKYSPFGATSLETAVYHLCRRALRGGGK